MRAATARTKALSAISEGGALLVYPIANRKEPRSLWSALYPRSSMHWAWDETADDRVVELWHLREELARSRKVVYAKWYRGRAVFFSRELFTDMLSAIAPWTIATTFEAGEIMSLLEENSPQSTKDVRREAGLRGRQGERVWERCMKELWQTLSIVGTGEGDDGSFPSLEIGATRSIFEDLWEDAARRERSTAIADTERRLGIQPAFLRQFRELRTSSRDAD